MRLLVVSNTRARSVTPTVERCCARYSRICSANTTAWTPSPRCAPEMRGISLSSGSFERGLRNDLAQPRVPGAQIVSSRRVIDARSRIGDEWIERVEPEVFDHAAVNGIEHLLDRPVDAGW